MRLNLIFTFYLIIMGFNAQSQYIEVVVIDSKTKNPIPYVNVYSPKSMEGTISNEKGRCIINNLVDTLIISHLAYKKMIKNFTLNDHNSTILLEPEPTILDEVTIYSLDIKEKLKRIQRNINRFYQTKESLNYNCTYKERFKANDDLKRLFQIQLEWHSKRGMIYDFSEPFYEQNQIKINSVDYSRIMDDTALENGGFVPNFFFFELLHINYYLKFILDHVENVSINSIRKTDSIFRVDFNGDVVADNKIVSRIKDAVIYFNSTMEYIHKIELDIVYNDQIHKGLSRRSKIPYETSINDHKLSIEFKKTTNSKLSLSMFKTEFDGKAMYNDLSFTFSSIQELLITALKKGRRISKKEKIDIKDPFYESVKEKNFKRRDVKFPLTEEESFFFEKLIL